MDVLLKDPEDGVHFVTDSEYRGTWNVLGMEGIGKYILPYNTLFEGELRDGTFHGHGSMYWPRGQRMDGVWYKGKCDQSRYTFNDGLVFQNKQWKYCKFPDRRYYTCLKYGLRPAGATLPTNNPAGFLIPPKCYDAGIGIFNPRIKCIVSYQDPNMVLEIPNAEFIQWIENNCRKAWSQPTGHREQLYENWYSTNFDTTLLSKFLPFSDNSSESWWRRLTTFQPVHTQNEKKLKSSCFCVKIDPSSTNV